MPIAKHFRGDKQKLRCIKRVAWPDQPFVAVIVGHVVRRQKDDVVMGSVEMPIGSVHDPRRRQHRSTLCVEVRDDKFVAFTSFWPLRRILRPNDVAETKEKDQLLHSGTTYHLFDERVATLCSR